MFFTQDMWIEQAVIRQLTVQNNDLCVVLHSVPDCHQEFPIFCKISVFLTKTITVQLPLIRIFGNINMETVVF